MAARGLVLAFVVVLLVPAAAVAGPVRHAPRHSFGRSTSTNWSGYDVTGSRARHVVGTWTQPAVVQCPSTENSWSSPWVGIDGDTSNTVEQIGTDSDCSYGRPTYYAWYEMYPKGLVQIAHPVAPGDSFTGDVVSNGNGSFTLTLADNGPANQWTFQTTQNSKRARLASIEWIMEGPSSGTLTNFGSVSFTGASGTISGVTGNLATFGNLTPITMVTNQGTPRATPSLTGSDAFSVAWNHQ